MLLVIRKRAYKWLLVLPQFTGQADSTVIGGVTAAERNVIAGQQVADIVIGGEATNSLVLGNYLGLNATGIAVVGLSNRGVAVNGTLPLQQVATL